MRPLHFIRSGTAYGIPLIPSLQTLRIPLVLALLRTDDGSFEVKINDVLVFSKLEKGSFPDFGEDLIKRLTSYYGLALRSNTDVEDMKKAVMATFHNVSSTDAEPHHELCPSGARSWCRHRAAEAEGKPQLPHTYNLPNKVVEALRPVYQRLFDPQLQARCSGNKTQNAAESLHSVIWSLISKQQHASHFTVEVAVHEAVESSVYAADLG
ncbi:hypothetical protein HPB52_013440 [Rhipicephalus sanguineus]|uniref:Uncharacterized protein n=1 Tax=Rhipicephalus sanguineus TaxID=34632 RepID=A0A9D4PRT9_RHISA|nr:hypothetical protein HPB52_013440 [Rhipicephalus sanguineus]